MTWISMFMHTAYLYQNRFNIKFSSSYFLRSNARKLEHTPTTSYHPILTSHFRWKTEQYMKCHWHIWSTHRNSKLYKIMNFVRFSFSLCAEYQSSRYERKNKLIIISYVWAKLKLDESFSIHSIGDAYREHTMAKMY